MSAHNFCSRESMFQTLLVWCRPPTLLFARYKTLSWPLPKVNPIITKSLPPADDDQMRTRERAGTSSLTSHPRPYTVRGKDYRQKTHLNNSGWGGTVSGLSIFWFLAGGGGGVLNEVVTPTGSRMTAWVVNTLYPCWSSGPSAPREPS